MNAGDVYAAPQSSSCFSAGTRVVLFGLRRDIPFLKETKSGQISFTSLKNRRLFHAPTIDDVVGRPATTTTSSTDSPSHKINTATDTNRPTNSSSSSSSIIESDNDYNSPGIRRKDKLDGDVEMSNHVVRNEQLEGPRVKGVSDTATGAAADSVTGEPSRGDQERRESGRRNVIRLPDGLSNIQVELTGSSSFELPPMFPLWESSRDSPDYNLATYMYWSQLHAEPRLYLNGVELKPQFVGGGGDSGVS